MNALKATITAIIAVAAIFGLAGGLAYAFEHCPVLAWALIVTGMLVAVGGAFYSWLEEQS